MNRYGLSYQLKVAKSLGYERLDLRPALKIQIRLCRCRYRVLEDLMNLSDGLAW